MQPVMVEMMPHS